jgi:SAM-dependent methyltransferase
MNRSSTATRMTAGPSDFLRTLHNTERLALHATIYTWASEHTQPGWVLDLGCEYGFGSLLIAETNPKLKVLGMDLDFTALGYSEGIPNKTKTPRVNASGHKLPIESERFSGVYLINLLHLVEEPAVVLSEAWRSLKPGGVAIVSIPQIDNMEAGLGSSPLIKQLKLELEGLFSEVIYPDQIHGQLPSFPARTFRLDERSSTWIAFCRKNQFEKELVVL